MYGESIGDMFYNVSADFSKAEQDLKGFEQKQSNRLLLIRIGLDLSYLDADIRKLDEKIGQSRTIKIKLDTADAEAQMEQLGGRFGERVGGGTIGRQNSVLAAAAPNIMGTSNGDVSLGPGQFLSNPISTGAVMANAMYRATPVSPGPSAPAATVNPDLMAWAHNPVMQAAYRGNPDVVGRQLADRLGVSPDDVQSAMSGNFGGQKSVTTASPLAASRAMDSYSSGRLDSAEHEDMRRFRSSTSAAFAPRPDSRSWSAAAARRGEFSANDALIESFDSLDTSIPSQMKQTQQALRRDSQAADLRAQRVARRDELQMQDDLRRAPLTDRELIDEQVERMGGNALPSTLGRRGGAGRGGSIGMSGAIRGFLNNDVGAAAGILGLEAIGTGAGMFNAGLNRNTAMLLARNDQTAQAQAELAFQKERNDAIPLMGGFGFQVRNAVNGMVGAITGDSGNRFGRTTDIGATEQGVQQTLGEAQSTDRITQIQHQGFVARRAANFQVAGLRAHQDPFSQQRITIAGQLDQATIEANAAGVDMRNNGATAEVANAEVRRRIATAGAVATAQGALNDRQESITTGQAFSQTRAAQFAFSGNSLAAAKEQFSAENLRAEMEHAPVGASGDIQDRYRIGTASIQRDYDRGVSDVESSNRSAGFRLQGLNFEGQMNDFYAERDRALRDIDSDAEPGRFNAVQGQFQARYQEMVHQENSRRAIFGIQTGRIDTGSNVLDLQRQHKYASAGVETILGNAGADIDELNAQDMRPEERRDRIRAIQTNARSRLGLFAQDLEDQFDQGGIQETGAGITRGDMRSRKEVESFQDNIATLNKLQSGQDMVAGLDKGPKDLSADIPLSSGNSVSLKEGQAIVTALQAIERNTEGGPRAT